jgi:hypothetical protein
MTEFNCENVCMAAMAIADGYQSEVSSEQIAAHLASCNDCRREVEEQQLLASLLDAQERRQRKESVWEQVQPRLLDASPAQSTSQAWYPFLLLGVLLLGYRLVEMIPDRHLGFLFKLVPVLFVIAAFSYLRENPFQINSQLTLEGRVTK